jgi:hypothetical protein
MIGSPHPDHTTRFMACNKNYICGVSEFSIYA